MSKPAKPTPDYIAGFSRACVLILGANKAKWSDAERRWFNKSSRMMFGHKRKSTKGAT